MLLINEGDRKFNDPITDYLPELSTYAAQSPNPVTPDFESITIGDLAGQMGGLVRDCTLSNCTSRIAYA